MRIILEVGKFKWILFVDITAGHLFAFSDEGERNTHTETNTKKKMLDKILAESRHLNRQMEK